ncbi:DUF3870 domain-containing protein [Geosporobacter ferrireducens]|uniref:DUF3870 domain-containing protein n=1 Tax=Geosporobacter ferrireducens TaxID=1424294 RepID=A0A1D8GG29_9FIRM|nr:DUF3870 domain-containing protein [Geosporobacter ferrireducens]AOT69871.1 hypothetical protein Gferi_09940 [Geosporobacter ferrireducens]MTI54434.1 DUF3870 domain-containing protein [Geosporobacter ferrireducens]
MEPYEKNTIYVVGDAKTAVNNPITLQFSAYFIAFVIDAENEIIIDAGASTTIMVTNQFVRSLFTGYSMKLGAEPMIEEINRRYHGSSQKAMIVAWKDAYKKYQQIKNPDSFKPID